MTVHLISRDSSTTAKKLAEVMNAAGVETTYGRRSPKGCDYRICYGIINRDANLNGRLVCNKERQLVMLNELGIGSPTVLQSGGLYGVKVADIPAEWYPFVVRRTAHAKGKDILWIPNAETAQDKIEKLRDRDFIVKYVQKTREFRVHVNGGRWVSASEKKSDRIETSDPNIRQNLIWAHRYGWKHMVVKDNDPIRPSLTRLGVKAAEALSFDFAAVDVMMSDTGELMVLEVNSAPSLNNRRAEIYAEYFMNKYKGV